jgi:hypothetical protein
MQQRVEQPALIPADQLPKRRAVTRKSLVDQLSVVVHSRSNNSDVLPASKVPA